MERKIITPNDLLNDTIFVNRIFRAKGEHFMNVMQKNIYGKHELIGRIYCEYDEQNKKAIYTARDYYGNQIFQNAKTFSTIKKRFREQGKNLAIYMPVNSDHFKESELREKELREIRKQNKMKDKGIER